MPDLDDVRGVGFATLHALTTAAMIVGVPVLIGRRIVRRRGGVPGERPVAVVVAAAVVGTALTVATQRTAWGLVRLWLRMDRRAEPRPQAGDRA